MSSAREARLRRRLRRDGKLLHKIPERSRWFNQYGPYVVVDADTTAILDYGCALEDIEAGVS